MKWLRNLGKYLITMKEINNHSGSSGKMFPGREHDMELDMQRNAARAVAGQRATSG